MKLSQSILVLSGVLFLLAAPPTFAAPKDDNPNAKNGNNPGNSGGGGGSPNGNNPGNGGGGSPNGNNPGNGGGGGGSPKGPKIPKNKKAIFPNANCAADSVAAKQCGSDLEGIRPRCCKGLVCATDGTVCVDPCGAAVHDCCAKKCDGLQTVRASLARGNGGCCDLGISGGTFPMLQGCVKPPVEVNGVWIESCAQLEVRTTGGSLGGCAYRKPNDSPVCVCNADVAVVVLSERTVIADGQIPSGFFGECVP